MKIPSSTGEVLSQFSVQFNWTHAIILLEVTFVVFFLIKIVKSFIELNQIKKVQKTYTTLPEILPASLSETLPETVPSDSAEKNLLSTQPIHHLDLIFDTTSREITGFEMEQESQKTTLYSILNASQKLRCRLVSLEFLNNNDFLSQIEKQIAWAPNQNARTLVIVNLSGPRYPFFKYLMNPQIGLEQTTENEIFWGVDISSSAEVPADFNSLDFTSLQNKINEIFAAYHHVIIVDRAQSRPTLAMALGFIRNPFLLDSSDTANHSFN